MSKVLVIGCGGVASVAISKCCQVSDVFTELCIASRTKGKSNIGCIFTGKKDGKDKTYYIYNVCDHQECYREVGSQAISYTTGVPAMCGALMMLTGEWTKPGVYTVEEFNPDPFLDALDKYGLPRSENHNPVLVD